MLLEEAFVYKQGASHDGLDYWVGTAESMMDLVYASADIPYSIN